MRRKILVFLIAWLCAMQIMATSLVIERYTGTQMVQDIALIGKWVFVDDNVQLIDKRGNILATEAIANIQKIEFSNSTSSIEDVHKGAIVVYPNPTQDILNISGIEAQTLRVYNLQGHMIQTAEGKQVDVSHLSTGTYLLQIGTQVIRFIKK